MLWMNWDISLVKSAYRNRLWKDKSFFYILEESLVKLI